MKKSRKPYKFCPEFQAVYDAMHKSPSMRKCINVDKRIRKLIKMGIWKKLDLLMTVPGFLENEHDALINWKEPNPYDIEIL